MKVEILAKKGIDKAMEDLAIKADRIYSRTEKPYYEVWQIEKSDIKTLELSRNDPTASWYCYSKGCNRGTPCEFLDVNGKFLIGWPANNGRTSFNTLLDYFKDGLDIVVSNDVCATAVTLSKANGITLGQLFNQYQR